MSSLQVLSQYIFFLLNKLILLCIISFRLTFSGFMFFSLLQSKWLHQIDILLFLTLHLSIYSCLSSLWMISFVNFDTGFPAVLTTFFLFFPPTIVIVSNCPFQWSVLFFLALIVRRVSYHDQLPNEQREKLSFACLFDSSGEKQNWIRKIVNISNRKFIDDMNNVFWLRSLASDTKRRIGTLFWLRSLTLDSV